MAKRRRRRLHYNKRTRHISTWLKTKTNAKSYTYFRSAIKNLFKSEENFNELVRRLETQTPGIFSESNYVRGPLYGKRNDKEAILEWVYNKAIPTRNDILKKNPRATNEQIFNSFFNTRAFASQEEIAINNMKKFLKKRDAQSRGFANELRQWLGVDKIDYSKLRYSKNISIDVEDEFGNINSKSQLRGYVFEGSDVAITMTGSGTQQSPYQFELHINRSTSI